MGRKDYQSFLKRYDRYAKPVSLTYKKSGSFETSCGGILSILSFIILAYWLVVNIFFAIYQNGTFAVSSQTVLTQQADQDYPLYSLD